MLPVHLHRMRSILTARALPLLARLQPSSSLSSLRPATRKSKVQLISPEALIASETSVGNGDLVASASSSSLSSESSNESSSTSSSEPSLSGSSSTLSILPNAAVYTPKPLSLDEVRKQKSYERLLMESAAASAPPRPLPSAPLKSILRKAPAPDPTAMTPEEREERASQQKAVSWASKLERLRTFKRDRRDTPHTASAIAGQHPQFRQAAKQEHIKEREAMGVKRQNEHQVWRKRAEKMLPTREWYTPVRTYRMNSAQHITLIHAHSLTRANDRTLPPGLRASHSI